jgi:hypothetical protein
MAAHIVRRVPLVRTETRETLRSYICRWLSLRKTSENIDSAVLNSARECWCVVDEVNDRPVGNPKRRFDEYSSKFSLSTKPRYVNPVGKIQYSRR